ncbi:hypothetical protein Tco_1152637 [Tanacetum coccineum]
MSQAIRFTAEATIKSINTKREWFYESCHQYSRTAVKRGDNYTCLDHGPQPGPFFSTFAHVTEFTLDDVFSINTSGDGTKPSVTTLPGTTHLTTDKEYSEEEEETSTSKEVNKGTPILSPAITTKTGKSQEEDDRAYEKSAKRRLILEPSAETKKPKGD